MLKTFINSLESENTKVGYETDIKQMLEFVGKPENEITYLDLINWTVSLKSLSAATQARKIIAVKSYFAFLEKAEVITKNETLKIKAPHVQHKDREFIPMEEAKKLIECGRNPRDKAIVAVMLSTGLRVAEVINLKLTDIEEDKLIVNTKRNKERVLWLNEDCKGYINDYLEVRKGGCDNLFVSNGGTPMRRDCISNMLKILAHTAGLNEKISPHWLRHTFITSIADKYGIDVACKSVGHANIATTMLYRHNDKDMIKNVMQEITL